MSYISIDGPVGKLEGYFDSLEGTHDQTGSAVGAVLCHPHPLYGGTMDDAVVQALNSAFRGAGIDTLRFNFRSVGASEGHHDKGVGEVDDVLAALNWMEESAGCRKLILAGYSFGAAMVLRACQASHCEKAVLVAPPVMMVEALEVPVIPALVILGNDDQIVDVEKTSQWFGDSDATVEIVTGADHFFHGSQAQIISRVQQFVAEG